MSALPEDVDLAKLLCQVIALLEARTGISPTPSTKTPTWEFNGVNQENGHAIHLLVYANRYDVVVRFGGHSYNVFNLIAFPKLWPWESAQDKLHDYCDGLRDRW